MKNKLFNTLLVLAAFIITCGAVATGSYFRAGITVKVGDIWIQRKVKAPAQMENKVATERNRAEAEARAENMKPILMQDPTVQQRVEDNLDALFVKLDAIRFSYRQEQDARRQAELDAGTASDEQHPTDTGFSNTEDTDFSAEQPTDESTQDTATDDITSPVDAIIPLPLDTEPETEPETEPVQEPYAAYAMFTSLPVIFTETQQEELLAMHDDVYQHLTALIYSVTDTTLDQGVQEIDNKILLSVRDEFGKSSLTEDAAIIGYEIVSAYLLPNVIVNEEATQAERDSIAAAYDQVFLQKDQTIVDEGEQINEEIYALMENMGMLNTGLEDKLIPILGVFLLIAAVFAACVMYYAFFRTKQSSQKKEPVLIFTLYVFVLAVAWTIGDAGYPFLPLLVFTMLVSVLIDSRMSVVFSMGMSLIAYFVVDGSLDYLLFFMIAGMLTGLLAKFTTERNKVFMVAFVAALINFVLSCAIALVVEKNNALTLWPSIVTTGGYAALNGLLTVVICTGSLPVWEVLFGVVTPVKLLDLTNPTNLLLRRLTIEAPGTYHHSLIVANLAETAAYDIGANPNTARVGGYYHDIGKLKYPQYFVENLAGENPHDSMDPYNSAQLIISHVTYGLTLAAEYRLPQFIRDIVQEHHGTTLMYFFYCKAKTEAEANDQTIDEKDFRYPYVIPQTRESACVMLADTVEAAVRSMIPRVKSIDEVENTITTLIRNKLHDGQLADSGLSIKDVDTISASFFRVLKGMYHERIPYPKMRTT